MSEGEGVAEVSLVEKYGGAARLNKRDAVVYVDQNSNIYVYIYTTYNIGASMNDRRCYTLPLSSRIQREDKAS